MWFGLCVTKQGWPHPASLGMEKAPIRLLLDFHTYKTP